MQGVRSHAPGFAGEPRCRHARGNNGRHRAAGRTVIPRGSMATTAVQGSSTTTPQQCTAGGDTAAPAPEQDVACSSKRPEGDLTSRRVSSSGQDNVRQAALRRLSCSDSDSDSEPRETDPRRNPLPMDDEQMRSLSAQIHEAERIKANRQKALQDLTGDFTSVDPIQAALDKLNRNAPVGQRSASQKHPIKLSPPKSPETQFLGLPNPNGSIANTPNSGSTRSRFSGWSEASTQRSSVVTTPEPATSEFDSRSVNAADSQSEGGFDSNEATPREERAAESLFRAP